MIMWDIGGEVVVDEEEVELVETTGGGFSVEV